jgi:GDP-4-dehydro-6-deoxy-D-mannose reductase
VRVLVTGARGFVGPWLRTELESAGHSVIDADSGSERLDVTDPAALRAALAERPDAVVHLAAISSSAAVAADPGRALQVNVGGTLLLLEAIAATARNEEPPVVLVAGSSEVYATPTPETLPLDEDAPLAPRTLYALTKAAQEGVALSAARRHGLRLVVTRAFNHTGPGQQPRFVVPALAERIVAVRDGRADEVRAGNLDVARDITDVRDIVRAYRLLLEALAAGGIEAGGAVYNVASGRSVWLRDVLAQLAEAADVVAEVVVDPQYVRADDPVEISGDASALHSVTGWEPAIRLEETLRDMLGALGVAPSDGG